MDGIASQYGRRAGRLPLRALDALVSRELLAGSVENRRRARMVVAVCLGMFAISLLMSLVSASGAESRGAAIGNAVFTLLMLGLACSLRLGVPIGVAVQLPLISFLFGALFLTLASQAQHTGILIALTTLPLSSIVLAGRRSALCYTAASLAGVGTIWWMQLAGVRFPLDIEPVAWEVLRFPVTLATIGWIAGASLVFEWLRGHALLEARRSREALEASEARYRGIAEHAGDVVLELDDELCVSYTSPNCLAVTGWPADQLLQRRFAEVVHTDDVDELERGFESLRTSEAPGRISFRFLHKLGSFVSFEASGNAYRIDSGERRFVIILRDVSELRRAELALRHSERLASTGTLAAGVAHQINNPIGAILAASEYALMLAADDDAKGVKRALEDIAGSARRCGEIVRSLLRFSRQGEAKREPTDLRLVISSSLALTKSYAKEHRVQLHPELPEEAIYVVVNTVEIEQVFVNLICNAVESRPESGRVDISFCQHGGLACLSVSDDGVGIAPADLARVVDPFFTTRLDEGGTGLGLSVAHGIVDEYGGSMRVESVRGKGTRVTVELATCEVSHL